MQDNDTCEEPIHELWLIYCLLKDAETDPDAREQLITSARGRLGRVVNTLNRYSLRSKSACIQAANFSCATGETD
jgi:hypothetical protein